MNVKDLMTKSVSSCDRHTNLSAASLMMWDGDCGVLPVVDEGGKVMGVITDRDIAMALATKNKLPSDILVGEIVEKRRIDTCSPDDDVKKALEIMAEMQIRRLPVVSREGRLQGIFSINDAILHARTDSRELSDRDVLEAMKGICSHGVPA